MTRRGTQPVRYSTALFALAVAGYLLWNGEVPRTPPPGGAEPRASAPADFDNRAILAAFESGRSDVVVEGGGKVVAVLPDDTHGSRHQRFIVAVGPGRTVLVSHNIDLAERIDGVSRGDTLRFRGEYEWNERGGVVHWTHRDPRGMRPGGWIESGGRRYR